MISISVSPASIVRIFSRASGSSSTIKRRILIVAAQIFGNSRKRRLAAVIRTATTQAGTAATQGGAGRATVVKLALIRATEASEISDDYLISREASGDLVQGLSPGPLSLLRIRSAPFFRSAGMPRGPSAAHVRDRGGWHALTTRSPERRETRVAASVRASKWKRSAVLKSGCVDLRMVLEPVRQALKRNAPRADRSGTRRALVEAKRAARL
jgi:hypothetical protein